MKGLFVVFHGFSAHSGITKKIFAQRAALVNCGVETGLCHTEIDASGHQMRMVDDKVIDDFGRGICSKIAKRVRFSSITRYIADNGIGFVYVRYDHNASPALVHLFRELSKTRAKFAVEIPTYPYDNEFAHSSRQAKLRLRLDKLFRRSALRYADKIVTFSDHAEIFGRPTIRISNGIDFAQIKSKSSKRDTSNELRLAGVANIHFWHGFDRVIEGLARYYSSARDRIVKFDIIGDGVPYLFDEYRAAIERYGLNDYVRILGPRSGEGLDEVFEWCDMGIASLARHRSGITKIKTLKNREYATRGIPFVYSETDDDFDQMPYVMKAPADESPLDIEALLRFYDSVAMSPEQIRSTIEGKLSWDEQMRKVIEQI